MVKLLDATITGTSPARGGASDARRTRQLVRCR